MSAPQSSPSHRTTASRLPARSAASEAAEAEPTYCFSVQAAADPGLLPRVLELFAKRDLVPSRCHAVLTEPGREELLIDLQVTGLAPEEAEHVARSLRQLVFVASVLTCIADARERLVRSA
jgi:acetolactate synthase small subunit